jgi:transposase, IS30 family
VTVHMTREQKQMARRLRAQGMTLRAVGQQLGYSYEAIRRTVTRVQRRHGMPDDWTPSAGRLRAAEREAILLGIARGETLTAIACSLGRSTSTVTREVAANGGRQHYRAWDAHRRARECARRPKPFKLQDGPLCAQVTEWLELLWSPEEISKRLRHEFPHDPMMHVSHETIYQSLYVQGRGELRRELARCLRTGRAKRLPKEKNKRGYIPDMVMISERPAEVADRAVPGHWEGDLIMGSNNASAVGTLVERSTRFVLLLHLGDGKTALDVDRAMRKAILTLPEELRRSVTWDQGKEMSNHVNFTLETGIPIYFCDPSSPWQRGSNENTNGLLRRYMPKHTDLSKYSAEDLEAIQRSLNGRPRKTLGYLKPCERLTELVALAA